jgi:tRNA nucleotidyltransferase/poly(A) polymerase
MNKEEMLNKLKSHKSYSILKELVNYKGINLVGGAVIDILEGREPKDYDIIGSLNTELMTFIRETKTAKTYFYKGITIQELKTDISDFDFKISQSSFEIKKEKESNYLEICTNSFNKKTLIPVNFVDKKNILNSLKRIPHWRDKGYDIDKFTYLSLIDSLNGVINSKS